RGQRGHARHARRCRPVAGFLRGGSLRKGPPTFVCNTSKAPWGSVWARDRWTGPRAGTRGRRSDGRRGMARGGGTGPSPGGRLTGDGGRWRVRVESWRVGDEFQGRIVFEPDGPASRTEPRVGPARLRGRSREDLLSSAYDLSEQWLRELLHALG